MKKLLALALAASLMTACAKQESEPNVEVIDTSEKYVQCTLETPQSTFGAYAEMKYSDDELNMKQACGKAFQYCVDSAETLEESLECNKAYREK